MTGAWLTGEEVPGSAVAGVVVEGDALPRDGVSGSEIVTVADDTTGEGVIAGAVVAGDERMGAAVDPEGIGEEVPGSGVAPGI